MQSPRTPVISSGAASWALIGRSRWSSDSSGPTSFSGFGIRTLSSEETAYNPIEYHNGTVWPHDTALIAEGMRRYGFRDEAARLVTGLLDAAAGFGHSLPELFAGTTRDATNVPVSYPGASCPQAWSAGSSLLGLRTLLGLDVDGGELHVDPALPAALDGLRLQGVRVHGGRMTAG